jgi:3-phenylpropionate/cinnamic acid dioxygenase small subunit
VSTDQAVVIQDLIDRKDIADVIYRFARGVDTCDWVMYRSCYADTVELDFSTSHGSTPPQTMSADKWIEFCTSVVPGFDTTSHIMSNIMCDIKGDTADVRVSLYAEHYLANASGQNSHVVGGFYQHQMKRTVKGWRIARAKLVQTYTKGPAQLFEMAADRVRSGTAPRMKRG